LVASSNSTVNTRNLKERKRDCRKVLLSGIAGGSMNRVPVETALEGNVALPFSPSFIGTVNYYICAVDYILGSNVIEWRRED
jgi:hypothetical protein